MTRIGFAHGAAPNDITQLLVDWSNGRQEALADLLPVVYDELRRAAKRSLRRERPNHTLSSTALVNEVYLQLVDQTAVPWQNRAHFFGIAANLMRQILVQHARRHQTAKRGGGQYLWTLDEAAVVPIERPVDLVALDDALSDLAERDARKGRIVELRFFGGLSTEETAQVLGISPRTVKREWRLAKARLGVLLGRNDGGVDFGSRQDSRPTGDLPDVGDAVQGHAKVAVRDCP
jgi:RNA polymerase sigma factor (TIGR02999 family)